MQAGNAGDGGDHHTGKQLHGSYVAFIESAGGGRQDFEDAESPAIVAQGRNQDGAYPEAATTGQVDAGVAFGVVAQHDFAGADGFGGDAGIRLEADSKIGSGAAGAGATDDFITGAQSDGGAGGSGEVLGTLGDGADGGLEIQFGRANVDFVAGMHGAETGDRMGGVGDAELTAKGGRRYASVMAGYVQDFPVHDFSVQDFSIQDMGIGDGAKQVADQAV